MKFRVIVADPPWSFNDRLKMDNIKRGAESNYDVLTTDYLCSLNIKAISDVDSILALWCPATSFPDGLRVMESWGFKYKTIWTWGKLSNNGNLSFGMGRIFRNCTEHVLIGIRGKLLSHIENRSQRSLSLSKSLKHSQKCEDLQDALDLMFPQTDKLELFARRNRNGWVCTGLECPDNHLDVNIAIDNMSKINDIPTYFVEQNFYDILNEKYNVLYEDYEELHRLRVRE